MDVREKLVDIVCDATQINGCIYSCNHRPCAMVRCIVDALIENGVTVQEWISVAEPPKEYRDEYGELIPFLVCEEGTDYPFRAMYDGKTWGDGIFAVHVKWWMHLPVPPKEKERKDGGGNV